MKLLLDTHILLWGILRRERIPGNLKRALEDPANELWLSPISVWECLILARKGRVTLLPDPESWIRTTLRELMPREAPITIEIAIRSRSIEIPHADPADRFLAATAAVFDLTLVTVDERLVTGEGFRVLTRISHKPEYFSVIYDPWFQGDVSNRMSLGVSLPTSLCGVVPKGIFGIFIASGHSLSALRLWRAFQGSLFCQALLAIQVCIRILESWACALAKSLTAGKALASSK